MNWPKFKEGREPHTAVIDFDGVLAESHWPDNRIGQPIQRGLDAVMHYFDQDLEVVIHTSRPETHKPMILAWLKEVGISPAIHDVICGKPRGFVYIDDKAFNPWTAGAAVGGDGKDWDEPEIWEAME